MLQVRCPKCAVTLSLKQSPPGGKVKCPKCAAIISVAQPAQTAAASRPTAGNAPAAPRQTPAAASGLAGDIDFRSIPVPPMHAPSGHFPMPGQARVYDGPISLDPIPVQRTGDEDDDDDEPEDQPQGKGQNAGKKAKQTKVIVSLVAGVVALVAAGGAGFVLMGGSSGEGGAANVDVAAMAAAAAPSGYQAKSILNCVVLMPKGDWGDGKKPIPSAIESVVVMSDETTSVFLLAAMDGGSLPIDDEQMRKKASRSLGGDILGGQPVERNGYKGIKGILDGSVFLPRMNVEVFHHDGRFVIIGHALGSQGGSEGTVVGGSPEEAKEVEVFLNSFKIGPPKTGFFGN